MTVNHEDNFLAANVEAARKGRPAIPSRAQLPFTKSESSCRVICRRFLICFLLLAVVLLSSIIYAIYLYSTSMPTVCHTKECLRSAAALKQNMDLSVDPCDDFYTYVCGKWADDHPRPERRGTHNWYAERQTKIYRNIRAQLETNISRSDPKPVAQAKNMYKACLIGTDTLKSKGFESVQKYLREFGLPVVPTLLNRTRTSQRRFKFDWISSVAKIQRKLGLNVIIGFDIVEDFQNRDRNRLTLEYFYSPGALEDFPIYEWSKLQPRGHTSKAKDEEVEVSDVDDEAEDEEVDEESSNEELAETLQELVELVNPTIDTTNIKYSFMTLAEEYLALHKELPVIDDDIEEEEPVYYTAAELQNITDSRITPQKPYPVWQHYLDVLFADLPSVKPSIDEKLQFEPKNVEFLGSLIEVVSKKSPAVIELYIWITVTDFLIKHPFNELETEEECAENVHKLMGLAVSYAIADRDFLEKTKPRVEQLLNGIRSEFDQMVLETDWMDAFTKYASLEKSKAMESLIGFPEWILDIDKLEEHYQGLKVGRFHFENWINALQLISTVKLQSWKVKNHKIWSMDPTEVNAFNLQARNAINIPVAIIQYPFYYLGLEALNYGALGEILGHELTHGFDDSGRHFDKFGNFKRWWSNQTLQEYDKRADCLVKQYSSYYVPEAKGYINGTLTLGENIADNGGLREAFRAYQTYVKRYGPEQQLPGFEDFSHEQLFFISFGNQNCESVSPLAAQHVLQDEHSPSKFRVRGVLSNMPEFSEVFKCPIGSNMNPEKKCRIW